MGRLARTVMVVSGVTLLVVMPREDYARLWAGTQVAVTRGYALIDRHIVKPIRIATTSREEPHTVDVPAPRPAVRPNLLGENARRNLEDVRIPDLRPTQTDARVSGDTESVALSADSKLTQSETSSNGEALDVSGKTTSVGEAVARTSDATVPVAVSIAADPQQPVDPASVPVPVAARPIGSSEVVAAVDTNQAAERESSAAGDPLEKAAAVDPDTEPAGQPPVPSEKPDVPPEKKPLPAAKLLFGAAKSPAPLAARAIGFYSRGCLSGGTALPVDGPAWQAMRLSRNRNWGHPALIDLIEHFASDVQKHDGWSGLLVGDISQPRGGPMLTGHASHQVGLDADIWFTPMPGRRLSRRERESLSATSMIVSPTKVDPTAFTQNHVRVVKRAASYPQVERILVHPAIKKALCEAAGTDRKWLGKVRPYFGHFYHFHMRIACPKDSKGCRHQPPPDGDDGCGKELDQWFERLTRPAPPKPIDKDAKPSPPKPPMTLADMPQECRAVIDAGGGPSTQDEAELVKTSMERSKKIIDISGEPREKLMQEKTQQ